MEISNNIEELYEAFLSGIYLWAAFACFLGVLILWTADTWGWPKWLAVKKN